jgi:hypothetical protein
VGEFGIKERGISLEVVIQISGAKKSLWCYHYSLEVKWAARKLMPFQYSIL